MKIIITFINGFLSVVLFAATIVCICAPQESISKNATFGLLFLTIYVVCNFIALIQNEEKPWFNNLLPYPPCHDNNVVGCVGEVKNN